MRVDIVSCLHHTRSKDAIPINTTKMIQETELDDNQSRSPVPDEHFDPDQDQNAEQINWLATVLHCAARLVLSSIITLLLLYFVSIQIIQRFADLIMALATFNLAELRSFAKMSYAMFAYFGFTTVTLYAVYLVRPGGPRIWPYKVFKLYTLINCAPLVMLATFSTSVHSRPAEYLSLMSLIVSLLLTAGYLGWSNPENLPQDLLEKYQIVLRMVMYACNGVVLILSCLMLPFESPDD